MKKKLGQLQNIIQMSETKNLDLHFNPHNRTKSVTDFTNEQTPHEFQTDKT